MCVMHVTYVMRIFTCMHVCMCIYIYMIYTFAVKFRLMRVQINEVNIYICLSVCVCVCAHILTVHAVLAEAFRVYLRY